MTYAVKEMFLTLQGEGVQCGRRAVFVRFAGCNLWTGREQDRATAICRFCDTDFVGTDRSEAHTSELQSLMRISYAVFCLKKKKNHNENNSAIDHSQRDHNEQT